MAVDFIKLLNILISSPIKSISTLLSSTDYDFIDIMTYLDVNRGWIGEKTHGSAFFLLAVPNVGNKMILKKEFVEIAQIKLKEGMEFDDAICWTAGYFLQ